MKNDYCIWQVCPEGYIHSHAFDEICLGLQAAFHELGYYAPLCRTASVPTIAHKVVVVGCNLLADHAGMHPWKERCIFYNLEQLGTDSPWASEKYFRLLREGLEVWDYSPANVSELGTRGVQARLCPIGYTPRLTCIGKAEEDIDVLFIGSLNARRAAILDELQRRDINTVILCGVYGAERDAYIARAKIVLNIHFYDSKIFEMVRCSYLMANEKFIISEESVDISYRERLSGIVFKPYEDLVAACEFYLQPSMTQERSFVAKHTALTFKRSRQSAMLRRLL